MTELNRALLDAIGDAFNVNDVDAVMAYFDDNAVFDHAAGPEEYGVRFTGKDEIHDVFAGLFEKVKNVHWETLDARIVGEKAYCEYRRSVEHADGSKEEYLSVDILTFKDGLIVRKDAYFKQRNA